MRRCVLLLLGLLSSGCSAVPDVRNNSSLHNPFPQLKRVAILPFFNQSEEPTLDALLVTESYYAALQSVMGFEVLPIGVVRNQLENYSRQHGIPSSGRHFQQFARLLDVDAVVIGAVTDYQPYYPPRMAITTRWYAANPGFHPIPPGYGLPWGTNREAEIPSNVVLETEFELARQQLLTQSPVSTSEEVVGSGVPPSLAPPSADAPITHDALPASWPDPVGLIPRGPQPVAPQAIIQHEPVLSHTRLYDGSDSYFTERLANFVSVNDERRSTGWQAHLSRTDDFVRFCCRLHLAEMLESRGGADRSELILRWPIGRYFSQ